MPDNGRTNFIAGALMVTATMASAADGYMHHDDCYKVSAGTGPRGSAGIIVKEYDPNRRKRRNKNKAARKARKKNRGK